MDQLRLDQRKDHEVSFTHFDSRLTPARGMVISTKMKNTIIFRRDYLHYVKKYNRFEKRHTNVAAHISPCLKVKEGDIVTVGQCR